MLPFALHSEGGETMTGAPHQMDRFTLKRQPWRGQSEMLCAAPLVYRLDTANGTMINTGRLPLHSANGEE
jgi:hypothetical protein